MRALFKEFYPAILQVVAGKCGGLLRPEIRILLLAASTPSAGDRLNIRSVTVALRRAGRERHLEQDAERIQAILRAPVLRQLPAVQAAMSQQLLGLLRGLALACQTAEQLADALGTAGAGRRTSRPAGQLLPLPRSFSSCWATAPGR